MSQRCDEKTFLAHLLVAQHKYSKSSDSSIFSFQKRKFHNQKEFNVCFIIPTGIGCEIGGHAGDGTVALKLIASSCNKVITHPNTVNASDINELPVNAFYVEGSHLTQLLMGNIGPKRSKSK